MKSVHLPGLLNVFVVALLWRSEMATAASIKPGLSLHEGSKDSSPKTDPKKVQTGGQMHSDTMPSSAELIPDHLKGTKPVSNEYILVDYLFHNYSEILRPSSTDVTVVNISLTLAQIVDIDQRHQKMITTIWLDQEWIDQRLTWNESYWNISSLSLPSGKLWKPDIVLYNNFEARTDKLDSNVVVGPNGLIYWFPIVKFVSFCKMDITYFPYDEQICEMKLGSWVYTSNQVDVEKRNDGIDVSNFKQNGEWELVDYRTIKKIDTFPCCPEPFVSLMFYFHLRRRIVYHMMNVVVPSYIMSLLAMLSFLLPPTCSEKISLGTTVLLAYTVFLMTVSESLPKTSEFIPIFGAYLTTVMSTTAFSTALSTLTINIRWRGESKVAPPPRWVLRLSRILIGQWKTRANDTDSGRYRPGCWASEMCERFGERLRQLPCIRALVGDDSCSDDNSDDSDNVGLNAIIEMMADRDGTPRPTMGTRLANGDVAQSPLRSSMSLRGNGSVSRRASRVAPSPTTFAGAVSDADDDGSVSDGSRQRGTPRMSSAYYDRTPSITSTTSRVSNLPHKSATQRRKRRPSLGPAGGDMVFKRDGLEQGDQRHNLSMRKLGRTQNQLLAHGWLSYLSQQRNEQQHQLLSQPPTMFHPNESIKSNASTPRLKTVVAAKMMGSWLPPSKIRTIAGQVGGEVNRGNSTIDEESGEQQQQITVSTVTTATEKSPERAPSEGKTSLLPPPSNIDSATEVPSSGLDNSHTGNTQETAMLTMMQTMAKREKSESTRAKTVQLWAELSRNLDTFFFYCYLTMNVLSFFVVVYFIPFLKPYITLEPYMKMDASGQPVDTTTPIPVQAPAFSTTTPSVPSMASNEINWLKEEDSYYDSPGEFMKLY